MHTLATHHPEVAAAARWYLEPVDYLAMRFTGEAAATHASMTAAWLTDNRRLDVLDYDDEDPLGELELGDGLRGVRLRTRIAAEGGEPVLLEQISVVDADTKRHYSFTVGCVRRCWEQHEDQILRIADSWTLEVQP